MACYTPSVRPLPTLSPVATFSRLGPKELAAVAQLSRAGAHGDLSDLEGRTGAGGWIWLSGFVGAGLVFAGISGWCGMARRLAVLPWNRPVG
jgi:hypothetical protein